MRTLPFWFIATATLFAVAGMGVGIYMGISQDHSLVGAHAHNNLVGWVTMALYGFYYKAVPSAAKTRLALVHFWVAFAGSLTIGIGIAMASTTAGPPVLAIVSSLVVILGMVLFAYIVWTNRAGLTLD